VLLGVLMFAAAMASSVCKWNTCFNQCRANNLSWSRSACKKQCNCWFLEGEEALLEAQDDQVSSLIASKLCRWNKKFQACQNETVAD